MTMNKERLKINICGRLAAFLNPNKNNDIKLNEAKNLIEMSDQKLLQELNSAVNNYTGHGDPTQIQYDLEDWEEVLQEENLKEKSENGQLLLQVLKAMILHYHYGEDKWKNTKQKWLNILNEQTIGLGEVTLFDDIFQRPTRFGTGWNRQPLSKSLKDQGFDVTSLSLNDLKYLNGVARSVVDFSCLGFGIRSYAEAIWKDASEELDKRKCDFLDLFDEEEEVNDGMSS